MLTEEEKSVYGDTAEVVTEDNNCKAIRIVNRSGEVVMTRYKVFEGVDIVYNDVHIEHCSVGCGKLGGIIEINHCREGRIECELRNEFFYLTPGDTSITYKDSAAHDTYFPIKHYHGISVVIDTEKSGEELSSVLEGVNIDLSAIAEKFCCRNKCSIMRRDPAFEHIFTELYSVPESIRKAYFRVKVLELLLFLRGMSVESQDKRDKLLSERQVTLAKNVCRYLTEHMEIRVTLEQLAEKFHVSGTQLKNCFKAVYGVSVYSYIRAQKMQAAALMIKTTDDTVLSIAGRFGYDNGSKCAKAFGDIMGMSPTEYRLSST